MASGRDAPPAPRAVTGARAWLLVVGIALVALNLRPALASVGPLVADIRADAGLSNAALGFITTLPLLAFGFLSVFASGVGRRLGTGRAVGAALVLVAVGTALRGAPPVAALYAGTALLGVGVALGNVLLPALAKRHFPQRSGAITGLYSSMMGLGAAAAAGLSVSIASHIGWRGALAIWAVPALVALLVWLPQMRPQISDGAPKAAPGTSVAPSSVFGGGAGLWRSPLAWQIAIFMGLQSLTFYVILAWLPDLLQSRGLSEGAAGRLLALSQGTGMAGSALVPVLAGAARDQRRIIWLLAALEAVGLVGLALPGVAFAWLWVSLLGFVLGGTFALSLTLLMLRSSNAASTASLSGMAQSICYLIAATGPPVFGFLHDVTRGWLVPLGFLMAVLIGKLIAGLPAGRPGMVQVND